jgi:hypothetical protein
VDRLSTLLSQFGVRANLFYNGKLCGMAGKSDGCWRTSLFADKKTGAVMAPVFVYSAT